MKKWFKTSVWKKIKVPHDIQITKNIINHFAKKKLTIYKELLFEKPLK